MFDYPVILTPDDGAILITFPDIPEAITFGETENEALKHAVDALETALSFYVNARQDLPVASTSKELKRVQPRVIECVKLALYSEMLKQGVRKAELARRLNCHTPQVDRLLDLTHASRLEQLEKALNSLGKRLDLVVA